MCFYHLVKTHSPFWHSLSLSTDCVAASGALRFSCAVPFGPRTFNLYSSNSWRNRNENYITSTIGAVILYCAVHLPYADRFCGHSSLWCLRGKPELGSGWQRNADGIRPRRNVWAQCLIWRRSIFILSAVRVTPLLRCMKKRRLFLSASVEKRSYALIRSFLFWFYWILAYTPLLFVRYNCHGWESARFASVRFEGSIPFESTTPETPFDTYVSIRCFVFLYPESLAAQHL